MRWIFRDAEEAVVCKLAEELQVPPLWARLLVLRGVSSAEQSERFLEPRLAHLHDPFLMRGMAAAVQRLRQALRNGEKILIYGDYDVDGTMASVVLLTALRKLGAHVEAYVPNRFTDGYGMRAAAIEQAAAQGFKLVVSVDTGIREHEALGRARELGIDCIVTDHHLPGPELPPACALLNPHQRGCTYPEKNLTGAAVAFKLAQALLGERLSEQVLKSYLKIVTIGCIADVAPLVGENRTIARFGLDGLTESAAKPSGVSAGRAGLSALLVGAGLSGKVVSSADVAFRLAPRLNAAGRMDDARHVIDLFEAASRADAQKVAGRLEALNRERRQTEELIRAGIEAQMKAQPERLGRYSLVFSGEGWHRGVIGIAAQRAVELYHRPVLVIAVEDSCAHGSGRSIPGFHLFDALSTCQRLFSRFGGHDQAAGFSLPASRVNELEAAFERAARTVLTPSDLEPTLRVDAEVSVSDLTWALAAHLEKMEPFGYGNPAPVFAANLEVAGSPRVLKEKHLRIRVKQGGASLAATGWRLAGKAALLKTNQRFEAAFTFGVTEFQGERELHLTLKDARPRAAGARF